MDFLNTREWALFIWILIFLSYIMLSPKMNSVRDSANKVIKALFVKKITMALALMITYTVLMVDFLFKLGLWKAHQLKNTVFWIIFIGASNLLRIVKIKENPNLLANLILDCLKLTTIIQFVVGFYTFNFYIEFFLVPFIFILGIMLAMADSEHIKKVLNGIMALFGSTLILFTVFKLLINFNEFAKIQTVYDFYIPPLLTLLYMPFLFLMVLFVAYETAFTRLNIFIKNKKLNNYSKLYALFKFRQRIKLLERWLSILPFQDKSSKNGIKNSIKLIFKIRSYEKNPPKIPPKEGWSPYLATKFLLSEGIKAAYYHPIGNQEWQSASTFIEIGDGLIPNRISYYVIGDETKVESLVISLNISSFGPSEPAHYKMFSVVNTLLKSALSIEATPEIESAIMNGENRTFRMGSFLATIEKNDFYTDSSDSYTIKFKLFCGE